MNKKLLITIGIIAIAAIVLFALRPAQQSSDPRPVIKIGAILPMTGDYAEIAQAMKKGIDFAIADINKNPNNKFIYQAIIENNQLQAKLVVPLANKLISSDHVSALITFMSGNAHATAPLMIQHKIIGIHNNYSATMLDGVYNFKGGPSNTYIANHFKEFINSKNLKRIAFVVQQTPATQEILEGMQKGIKGQVREFAILPSERDFKMLVRKIKDWKPDLILISIDAPAFDIWAAEMRRQELGGIKLSWDLTARTKDMSLIEGFYTLNAPVGSAEFLQRFDGGLAFFAPYFYDDIMIFAKAVENAANDGDTIPNAEEISAEIKKLKVYDGVIGHYDILETGEFLSSMILYKIENGKPMAVK